MNTSITNTFQLLNSMNIPFWGKRPDRRSKLFFEQPKMFARLLVVLSKKIPNDNLKAQKVFQGMLKVLDLDSEEICHCWMLNKCSQTNSIEFDRTLFYKNLHYWQPQNILFLGQFSEAIETEECQSCYTTYHPEELVTIPQYKKSAYQILLSLKEVLNRGVPSA